MIPPLFPFLIWPLIQKKQTCDIEDFAEDKSTCDSPSKVQYEKLDKLRGFVLYARHKSAYRPTEERVHDWSEVYDHRRVRKTLRKQAARCMDCGVPFCQSYAGCPLGNLIPNWNDLVFNVSFSSEKSFCYLPLLRSCHSMYDFGNYPIYLVNKYQ